MLHISFLTRIIIGCICNSSWNRHNISTITWKAMYLCFYVFNQFTRQCVASWVVRADDNGLTCEEEYHWINHQVTDESPDHSGCWHSILASCDLRILVSVSHRHITLMRPEQNTFPRALPRLSTVPNVVFTPHSWHLMVPGDQSPGDWHHSAHSDHWASREKIQAGAGPAPGWHHD